MSKVTSKLQITVPKAIAEEYGIRPGDEVDWVPAGAGIRLVPRGTEPSVAATVEERLALFDQATHRQEERDTMSNAAPSPGRGWTRDELYDRG